MQCAIIVPASSLRLRKRVRFASIFQRVEPVPARLCQLHPATELAIETASSTLYSDGDLEDFQPPKRNCLGFAFTQFAQMRLQKRTTHRTVRQSTKWLGNGGPGSGQGCITAFTGLPQEEGHHGVSV
ncbi:biotin synthase [Anopheles sinensis]|uniref:Biotin synthase n=1 Tax=Anopheles sinensis TaxID=74873 RepID=A0A084W359_ANOSI|nr:biotin synthase [Anopheles sinensis]